MAVAGRCAFPVPLAAVGVAAAVRSTVARFVGCDRGRLGTGKPSRSRRLGDDADPAASMAPPFTSSATAEGADAKTPRSRFNAESMNCCAPLPWLLLPSSRCRFIWRNKELKGRVYNDFIFQIFWIK